MYIVTLGTLQPLQYDTIELAWESHYLDGRRGCMCMCLRGCRCKSYDRFMQQLTTFGIVKLHAATVIYQLDTQQNSCNP